MEPEVTTQAKETCLTHLGPDFSTALWSKNQQKFVIYGGGQMNHLFRSRCIGPQHSQAIMVHRIL